MLLLEPPDEPPGVSELSRMEVFSGTPQPSARARAEHVPICWSPRRGFHERTWGLVWVIERNINDRPNGG